jgi:beta-lactam-binding protein with PASTA domain
MTEALKGQPIQNFPYTLDKLITVRVDILRNCQAPDLPTSDVIVDRQYLKGQEPTVMCNTLPPPTTGLIPNVVGRMEPAADSILQQASFSPQSRHVYCPDYPNGYVCSQYPTAGSYTLPGSTVTVYVSDDSASASVPMVLGLTADDARSQLEADGFTVSVVTDPNAAGPAGCRDPKQTGSGRVWLQSPCAGESAGAGTTVRLYVNP